MNAILLWLDKDKKRHYGRIINIVDSTVTVQDINTGEEVTFWYKDGTRILHWEILIELTRN